MFLRRGPLTDVLDEFGPSGRRNGIVKGEVVLLVEGCATDTASLLISAAAAASSTTLPAESAAAQQEGQLATSASSTPAGERIMQCLSVLYSAVFAWLVHTACMCCMHVFRLSTMGRALTFHHRMLNRR
jgi:hypothetical protein